MPRVTIHGVSFQAAKSLGMAIKKNLVSCDEIKPEHVQVQFLQTIALTHVEEEEWLPMIDILWFGRSQEVQDKVAEMLTQLFWKMGFENLQVTFQTIAENCFYENGQHY